MTRSLASCVAVVQAIQADLYTRQHAPLSQIRRWSGRPEDAALFESCFIFVKFPTSAFLTDQGTQNRHDLQLLLAQTQTEHPVRIAATVLGPTVDLQFLLRAPARRARGRAPDRSDPRSAGAAGRTRSHFDRRRTRVIRKD